MTNNCRITSYFRNGLAYISISQLKNKDNNVIKNFTNFCKRIL